MKKNDNNIKEPYINVHVLEILFYLLLTEKPLEIEASWFNIINFSKEIQKLKIKANVLTFQTEPSSIDVINQKEKKRDVIIIQLVDIDDLEKTLRKYLKKYTKNKLHENIDYYNFDNNGKYIMNEIKRNLYKYDKIFSVPNKSNGCIKFSLNFSKLIEKLGNNKIRLLEFILILTLQDVIKMNFIKITECRFIKNGFTAKTLIAKGLLNEPIAKKLWIIGSLYRAFALFTKQESKIIALILDGKSDLEIADMFKNSKRTIMNHVRSIKNKLNLGADKSRKDIIASFNTFTV